MIANVSNKIDGVLKKIKYMLPAFNTGNPLTNKWVLYLVFAGAVYEMFSYFMRYDFYAISIFFIVGFLASFFSKNMVVIMIMAIAFTRLLRYGQKLSEGFAPEGEGAGEGEEEEEEADDNADTDADGEDNNPSTKEVKEAPSTEDDEPSMTDTTKKLLQNQKTLMENMEALKPVLKQAESFLAASNEKKMEKFTTLAKAY